DERVGSTRAGRPTVRNRLLSHASPARRQQRVDFQQAIASRWPVDRARPGGSAGSARSPRPLGPAGAHGYRWDTDTGEYVDDAGNVVHTVQVPYGDGVREYPLYEFYSDEYARTATDNDTSFMVETSGLAEGTFVDYPLTSPSSQWITVLVVPQYMAHSFPEVTNCVQTSVLIDLDTPWGCAQGRALVDDF